MKKQKAGKKFSRTTNERKQLFRALIRAFVLKGYMHTTLTKGKATQRLVEKLVTQGKHNKLNALRSILAETADLKIANLLLKIGAYFRERPGGYTRLIRLGQKTGDNSQVVRLEWVERLPIYQQLTPAQELSKSKKSVSKNQVGQDNKTGKSTSQRENNTDKKIKIGKKKT